MKFGIRVLLLLLTAGIFTSAGTVQAQVDPTKALIGIWEGRVANIPQGDRIIEIKSVKAKEDGSGWTADGRFGQTRDKLLRMTYEISREGSDIIVEFVVQSTKNPGKLKLVGENRLDGEMDYIGAGGKHTKRTMVLDKVEGKKE